MHIEPGFVAPAKVAMANVGAVSVIAYGLKEQFKDFVKNPWTPLKTVLAAAFFTLFMQSYHAPVGPSELHFVGAMVIYLTFGFTPALLGFAAGLLFQGLVFQPMDLYHLGVNSLSLMLPLIGLHATVGKRYVDEAGGKRLSWRAIVKLDAIYYTGVTGMVGFWLMIGDVATPLSAWATFAASYLVLVACEPVITYFGVKTLKSLEGRPLVARLTAVKALTLA